MDAAVSCPYEGNANVDHFHKEGHELSDYQVQQCRQIKWKQAVPQKANALEEADGAAEELTVDGDDSSA